MGLLDNVLEQKCQLVRQFSLSVYDDLHEAVATIDLKKNQKGEELNKAF